MKKLILGVMSVACVLTGAMACAKEVPQIAGLGVRVSSSAYRGVGSSAMPVPMFRMSYKKFFIDGKMLGGVVWGERGHGWSLAGVLEPRFMGYNHKDSDFLTGMSDRRWGADAGVRLAWKGDLLDWSLTGLTDITGRSDGQEVRTAVSKTFAKGFFTPSLGVKWQSARIVDYYYGVQDKEALASRPAYKGESVLNPYAGVRVGFPLVGKWAAVLSGEYEWLGTGAAKSPIVDDKHTLSGMAGVAYRF